MQACLLYCAHKVTNKRKTQSHAPMLVCTHIDLHKNVGYMYTITQSKIV